MPWKRRPVEDHQHQTGLAARDEQRRIVQAEPRAILPACQMNDRESEINRRQAGAARCDPNAGGLLPRAVTPAPS
jgi:hypothetical protein